MKSVPASYKRLRAGKNCRSKRQRKGFRLPRKITFLKIRVISVKNLLKNGMTGKKKMQKAPMPV
jgi:hypothetical protein